MSDRRYAGSDPMLRRLVGELLLGPNQNLRLAAGLLLAASPYRDRVGAVIGAELTSPAMSYPGPLRGSMLAALAVVGRPSDRAIAEQILATAPTSSPLADSAAWSIGHIPGVSSTEFWHSTVHRHRETWRRDPHPTTLSVLRGLAYALGMTGNHALLRQLRVDVRLPAPVRATAAWWLNLPAHIVASTQPEQVGS